MSWPTESEVKKLPSFPIHSVDRLRTIPSDCVWSSMCILWIVILETLYVDLLRSFVFSS